MKKAYIQPQMLIVALHVVSLLPSGSGEEFDPYGDNDPSNSTEQDADFAASRGHSLWDDDDDDE